ncbi:hypothetical protein ACFV90_14995 [Streptomyces sp. NPDC059904]|uniref:hypothetical protein n=1 Tax=Streptomyces sp. NPDC059904 TaxID=3346996 RepID=UPI00365955FA
MQRVVAALEPGREMLAALQIVEGQLLVAPLDPVVGKPIQWRLDVGGSPRRKFDRAAAVLGWTVARTPPAPSTRSKS